MSENHAMRRTAAAIACVAALALSACGGSGGGGSTTSASSVSSASTTAPSTSTSGAPTAPKTTPGTTISRPPFCDAARLTVSFLGQQGATGHGLLGFAVRNRSSRACHTYGFPGVLFLDRAGRPLPTHTTRVTRDFFGVAPEVRLILAPGHSASFRVGVTHGMTSTVGCTTAYGLQVIPPDDTATLRTHIPMGAYECRTATLSPLRPGRSAYP